MQHGQQNIKIDSMVYVTLQWNESNERQILLRNMDFEASSTYCCEVSTQTPIYTKLSDYHELTVIRKCAGGGSTEHDCCPVRECVRCSSASVFGYSSRNRS
jgi:hypothetical protein